MLWNLRPLAGVMLRYEVCLVLRDAGRPLTISDIVSRIRRDGFEMPVNANKVVSDALRWELRRKRVDRLRRGLYEVGRVPRSSEFRMRRTIEEARRQLRVGPRFFEPDPTQAANPADAALAAAEQTAPGAPAEAFRNSLERETERPWSPLVQDVALLERAAERHFRAIAEQRRDG